MKRLFCRAVIFGRTLPKAFLLPRGAIGPDGTVFLVKGGKLFQQAVKVARYADDEALILPGGGIAEGDHVVSRYMATPVVGMAVNTIDKISTTASAAPPASTAATAPARAKAATE